MLRLSVTLLALCAVAFGQDSRNIMQYLDDEGFTTLTELIRGAGLEADFEDLNAIKTLFAPSNDAFKAVPPETLAALQTSVTLLREVLSGHVVAGDTVLGLFIRDGLTKTTAT